jgi:hypothetical protein
MSYKSISPISVSEGGTGIQTATIHGVVLGNTTSAFNVTTAGSNGQVLVGSTGADPVMATIASSDSSITYATGAGTLGAIVTQATTSQKGGTTLATNAEAIAGTDTGKIITADDLKAKLGTQTNHGVLVGAGTTAAVSALGVGTNGQLLVGSSAANPAFATLGVTGLVATTGAGTLSIASLASDTAFMAYITTTISNVSGDGTVYTVLFDTKSFDLGTHYTTGTGSYAAPRTGQYVFGFNVNLQGLLSTHTQLYCSITANGTAYYPVYTSPFPSATGGVNTFSGQITVPMTAAGTATIQIKASGGTKVVGLYGTAVIGLTSYFYGYQVA